MECERKAVEKAAPLASGISFSPHGLAPSARPLHRQTMDCESKAIEKAVPFANDVAFQRSPWTASSLLPLSSASLLAAEALAKEDWPEVD